MFIFKKVTIDNFRTIGHVELELDNQGLVLVEGINNTNQTYVSNGSGKSTMLSAIPWALYDVTPEGSKADSVINNKVGKNTSVILEFEVDDLPYRIERYRKHKKHKNKVLLFQGDNDLTQNSASNTNKKILDLFGIDLNTFLNSIMYGQGDVEIFAKATDKGKKEILENVANIAIYQEAQTIAKEKCAQARLAYEAKEQEKAKVQYQLDTIELQEASEAENYKKTADLIKHQQQVIVKLEQDLQVAQSNIEQKSQDITNQKATLELELSSLEDVETPQELTDEYNIFNNKITQLNSHYQSKLQEINNLRKNISSLDTSDTCYACGTKLDTSHQELEKAKLEKQIVTIQQEIAPTEQALPVFQAQLAKKKQELDNIYYKITNVNTKKQTIQSSLINLAHVEQNIGSEVYEIEVKLTSSKEQLASLESLPKPTKKTKEKNKLKKEIKAFEESLTELAKDVEDYDLVATKVFSNKGIRSHVLDLTTPFLNEKTNSYLATLSGSDIQVNLNTQKLNKDGTTSDSFDLQVFNSSGGSSYKDNSAGERKRIDLAIALAIQDLVFSKSNLATNLVVYDECFDGLDSIGCENVIDILKNKQKEVGSIFVITHNEGLKSLFEKVITVEKVNGTTSLVNSGERQDDN